MPKLFSFCICQRQKVIVGIWVKNINFAATHLLKILVTGVIVMHTYILNVMVSVVTFIVLWFSRVRYLEQTVVHHARALILSMLAC